MQVFKTQLPELYAVRLDGRKEIDAHVRRLYRAFWGDDAEVGPLLPQDAHWHEELQAIVKTRYNVLDKPYHDIIARRGQWVLWCSSASKRFFYRDLPDDVTEFPKDQLPQELLDLLSFELATIEKPTVRRRPSASQVMLPHGESWGE